MREKAADWEVRYEQQGAQKEELLQKVMELQEERAQHLARIAVQESQRDAQGDLRAEFDELKKLVSRLSERRDEKG